MPNDNLSQNFLSFASSWVDAVFDSISSLADREFKVQVKGDAELSAENISDAVSKFQIAVRIPISQETATGETCLLMPIATATALADLLGDGEGASSEELSDDARNALQEGVNQTTTAAEAALKNRLGDSLSLGSPTIVDVGAEDGGISDLLGAEPAGVEFDVTCADTLESNLLFLMPGNTVKQFAESLSAQHEGAEGGAAATATQSAPESPDGTPDEENLGLILDVELSVVARLGQVEMPIKEVLALGPGSIIEVGRSIEEPVELLVNNKLVARGEVVVTDEKFGLRITEVVSTTDRVKSLR